MDLSKYKDLFISESGEILARLNNLIVELEKKPDNPDFLNEIFRQAHTLKGMSASMGYNNLVVLTHAMENVLDLFRKQSLLVDAEAINALLSSCDILSALVKEATGAESSEKTAAPLIGDVLEKLNNLKNKAVPAKIEPVTDLGVKEKITAEEEKTAALSESDKKEILGFAKENEGAYKVTFTLSKDSAMKQARAYVVLRCIKSYGAVLNEEFFVNKYIKCPEELSLFTFLFVTGKDINIIKRKIKEIPEVDKIEITAQDSQKIAEELGAAKKTTGDQPEVSGIDILRMKDVRSIRVSVDHLDNLMNLIGELVIQKVKLSNTANILQDKPLSETAAQVNRISDDIQNEIMAIRLVPMSYIFDRFPRMIRDLANEENKKVNLEVEGSDIGLDRTILDEISDPLVHLLRNAVNHGVELPKERSTAKKPSPALIKLTAKKERNFVVIEVSDDGCGMDVETIKKKAIEKNIITKEEADKLSYNDALMLITVPGFSMTENVTETSGRGVGMNVVKSKAESFGGSLSIETMPGEGSKFTVKLPVSMAILQALLVGVGQEVYAIPLTNVAEVIKIKPDLIKTMEHREVIPYREEVLPLVELREKFGFVKKDKDSPAERSFIPIVVVEIGHKKAGFVVDELLGNQEVVIKTLTGDLKKMKGVAGATIMGDGNAALIVDALSII